MPKIILQDVLFSVLVCFSLFLATNVRNFSHSYLYFIAAFFILSSIILYKLFSSYKKNITLPNNSHFILFILFVFLAASSLLWSPVPSDSYSALSMFYLFPLAFILGFWSNSNQQKYFHSFLVFLLLAIFWKATQQRFFLLPSLQAPGFFANKNTNAIFICMILLPICAKFLSKGINKENQLISGAILFIGTFIISLTVSRGAVLGLTIGLFFLLIHLRLFKQPLSQFIKLLSYLSAGYISADLINGGANVQRLTQRTLSTNINHISSGRGDLWASGWEMFQDQPFLGWGLNMFHWLFPQYRHIDAPDLGQYVHNDYFQFLIELGPVGFLLFIGFVFAFLVSARKLYTLTKNQDEKLLSLGLISACIAVFIHSFFTFNLYQPAPLLLLGLYIGVLTQRLNNVTARNNILFQASKATTPVGYFSLLSILSLTLIYFTSVNALSIKKIYTPYKNKLIALDEAETAHQLTSYKESILAVQLGLYINLLYNKENNLTSDGKKYLIDRGIKVSKEAINKNPYSHLIYINRAKLYLLASEKDYPNRTEEIKKAFNQAIKVNPFSMFARVEYVKVLMQFNEKQQAIKVFEGGLGRRYYGNYQDPVRYLQLFLTLITASENKIAIQSLKQQIDFLLEK
ncbi:MAG: O-antigen ligase family protein, partial [Methylococcales bacterium]|nr:O-antigen ligase family protein [Methylococcales bacterium]